MNIRSVELVNALLLIQVYDATASPLAEPLRRSLIKRAKSFECENDTIPYGDGQFEGFSSLTELCGGYPLGIGFFCAENGHLAVRAPLSIISQYVSRQEPEIIQDGCQKCKCFDGAPEVSEPEVSFQAEPCDDENQNPQANPQAPGQGAPLAPRTCENSNVPAFWRTQGDPASGVNPVNCAIDHGKPMTDDCDLARSTQEDRFVYLFGTSVDRVDHVEFLAPGDTPRAHPETDDGAPTLPIKTPFTDVYGSCAVSIMLSGRPGAPTSDVAHINQILSTIWDINAECVEKDPPNVGGFERIGLHGEGIEIHVYAIGTEIDRLVKSQTVPSDSMTSDHTDPSTSSGDSEGDHSASSAQSSTIEQPPTKKMRVCSSPVACTDAAVRYICHWKAITTARTVVEMLYGSLSTIVKNNLAICIAPGGNLS